MDRSKHNTQAMWLVSAFLCAGQAGSSQPADSVDRAYSFPISIMGSSAGVFHRPAEVTCEHT